MTYLDNPAVHAGYLAHWLGGDQGDCPGCGARWVGLERVHTTDCAYTAWLDRQDSQMAIDGSSGWHLERPDDGGRTSLRPPSGPADDQPRVPPVTYTVQFSGEQARQLAAVADLQMVSVEVLIWCSTVAAVAALLEDDPQ